MRSVRAPLTVCKYRPRGRRDVGGIQGVEQRKTEQAYCLIYEVKEKKKRNNVSFPLVYFPIIYPKFSFISEFIIFYH